MIGWEFYSIGTLGKWLNKGNGTLLQLELSMLLSTPSEILLKLGALRYCLRYLLESLVQ